MNEDLLIAQVFIFGIMVGAMMAMFTQYVFLFSLIFGVPILIIFESEKEYRKLHNQF